MTTPWLPCAHAAYFTFTLTDWWGASRTFVLCRQCLQNAPADRAHR